MKILKRLLKLTKEKKMDNFNELIFKKMFEINGGQGHSRKL